MTTQVMTLREYADALDHLAETWDEDPPAVLIGDVTGDLSISAKDGHTMFGNVGFASEAFQNNGVQELSAADTRFHGTILLEREHLSDDGKEQLAERDSDV